MSKTKSEKRNPNRRKLSLNRETLRILSAERLEQVAGGDQSIGSSWMPPPTLTCTFQATCCIEWPA